MESLVGKHIREEDFDSLEKTIDAVVLERDLFQCFRTHFVDGTLSSAERVQIISRLYLRSYCFCKEQAFDYRRTSAFLSIIHEVFLHDIQLLSNEVNMDSSFSNFEKILLRHSVERSPHCLKVFDREEVPAIIDFALQNYFQHFKLLHSLFGTQARVILFQQNRSFVEHPPTSFEPLPAQVHNS